MAPHVQRVFGASPSAVGKLLFSAPSVSLVPVRSWFSFSYPALSRLLFLFSEYSRAFRTLAQSPLLFPYFFSILQAHPVPPGHLLVRPWYPNISKRKTKGRRKNKREKKNRRKEEKTAGPCRASQRNVKLGYVKTGGWRFSLKPMGD